MRISSFLAGGLIAVACSVLTPALAQNLAKGEALAEQRCARCHGIKPGQKSKHGLAPTFPKIANRYSVWGLQEALAEGIVVGHADMPRFVFSPEEINDLLAFMDTFSRKKGSSQ
ncbi:MAG: c-type cytochrome [Hyphomicrobiaceae bacterium]